MKILAVHSALSEDPNKQSQVDHWRVYRPMRELAKHVDWQIDHVPTYIPGFEKYQKMEDFTKAELEKAFKKICEYDIVFSSYHADHTAYTMLKVAQDKAGVQFIMDADDDVFAINEDNPFWVKMTDEKAWLLQVMVRENRWITTTTDYLAKRFRERRQRPPDNHPDDSVIVLPNFIPNDYKEPKFNNKDKIVIGYFGGSSHYTDLHETGVAEALEKLMHENKKVHFKAVGMPLDKYVPRGRYTFENGKRGTLWQEKVFPSLKMDISIAPLHDNVFNYGKSDIKWQEATRMGSALVASNIGPYASLPKSVVALTENTEEGWYRALKKMVDDVPARERMVRRSRKELEGRKLEVNWNRYKEAFERVKNEGGSRHNNVQPTRVSTKVS